MCRRKPSYAGSASGSQYVSPLLGETAGFPAVATSYRYLPSISAIILGGRQHFSFGWRTAIRARESEGKDRARRGRARTKIYSISLIFKGKRRGEAGREVARPPRGLTRCSAMTYHVDQRHRNDSLCNGLLAYEYVSRCVPYDSRPDPSREKSTL